jgi:RNA polymerase sigma-70 factor (ECF subfamily)
MTSAREEVADAARSPLAVRRAAAAGLPSLSGRPRARTEQSLITGALAGSEADLEALFVRHWPRAHRAAFLIVHDHAAAEDIAQEAFLAAVRNLHRFDRRRRFGPWLSAIVANRAIDWVRARSTRPESGPEPVSLAAAPEPAAAGYSTELLAALAALTVEQRAVVVLRYVLEYTPGEIAAALGLPRGTVNSRLRRALDGMQASLRATET